MTTLDEQMQEIERLAVDKKLPLECAYGEVYDAEEEWVDDFFLVACANAAPALVQEVRRLREENGRLQMDRVARMEYKDRLDRQARVMAAVTEWVVRIDEDDNHGPLLRVAQEYMKNAD